MNVLRSIIRQFFNPDDVTGEIEKQLNRLKASSYATETDIIETLLQHCIRRFSMLYIILDALDEFEKEERKVLLRSLSSLTSLPNSKVKLFLVGRSSVSEDMKRWCPASQQKSTDCREVQTDIEAYAREVISLRQEERSIPDNSALTQKIVDALTSGADGM